jgi:hypothetical protein
LQLGISTPPLLELVADGTTNRSLADGVAILKEVRCYVIVLHGVLVFHLSQM